MKYPQPVSMPSAVSDWLEEQLEARGIDAVVYTRYVLSLLHAHTVDVIYPDEDGQFSRLKKEVRRSSGGGKRCRGSSDWWRRAQADAEQIKRSAAVECLMSASDQNCEIESLVDELCEKLKEVKGDRHGSASPVVQQQPPPRSKKITPQELAEKYYAAFPPLPRAPRPSLAHKKKKKARCFGLGYFSRSGKTEPGRSERSQRRRKPAVKRRDSPGKLDNGPSEPGQRETTPAWANEAGIDDDFDLNMYEDLPVDIEELLDSPESTPHRGGSVEMMNAANMNTDTTEAGNRRFIPYGTSIAGSIWSNEGDGVESDVSLLFPEAGDSRKQNNCLDFRFSSISIMDELRGGKFFEKGGHETAKEPSDEQVFKSLIKLNHDKETSVFKEIFPKGPSLKSSWDRSSDHLNCSSCSLNRVLNFDQPLACLADDFSNCSSNNFSNNCSLNCSLRRSLDQAYRCSVSCTGSTRSCFDCSLTRSAAENLQLPSNSRSHHDAIFEPFCSASSSYFSNSGTENEAFKDDNKATEDLLTSERSHFKPIPMGENFGKPAKKEYADGATFQVSNSLDKVDYERSQSGSMMLETELGLKKKYLEYKFEDNLLSPDLSISSSEFVLKFNVCQNDKACQTEDSVGTEKEIDDLKENDEAVVDEPEDDFCFYFEDDVDSVDGKEVEKDLKQSAGLESVPSELLWKYDAQQCEKCDNNNVWSEDWSKGKDWNGDLKNIWSGGEVCETCSGLNRNRKLPASRHNTLLREDISQDGEQLLSDLSSLQKSYMENDEYEDDVDSLPACEYSCDIGRMLGSPTQKERKRRHSLITSVGRGSWSFASRLEEDCLIQMSTIPTLRSVTL